MKNYFKKLFAFFKRLFARKQRGVIVHRIEEFKEKISNQVLSKAKKYPPRSMTENEKFAYSLFPCLQFWVNEFPLSLDESSQDGILKFWNGYLEWKVLQLTYRQRRISSTTKK